MFTKARPVRSGCMVSKGPTCSPLSARLCCLSHAPLIWISECLFCTCRFEYGGAHGSGRGVDDCLPFDDEDPAG